MIGFTWPLVLLALPLALLPLFRRWLRPSVVTRLDLRPRDGASTLIDRGLTGLGVLGIAALVVGIAGPFLRGSTVPHRGIGANIVLLIDRSSSMDDTFAGRAPSGAEESKSSAARRILLDFITHRPDDRVGIAAFSTSPMQVLPMTQSRSAISAAIAAQGERGLSQTDIGRGLVLAMRMLEDTAADGSRAIVMVSDGAGVIAPEVQEVMVEEARRRSINLYWLYLRTAGSQGIFDIPAPGEVDTAQRRPERHLHLLLQRLGLSYQAFEADSPDAVAQAVAEIDKLEAHPILTERQVPRRDLDGFAWLLAALCAAGLTVARWLERDYAPRPAKPALVRA